jgi:oligopeptide/dipeptide ABC transporter ATP-binding protein
MRIVPSPPGKIVGGEILLHCDDGKIVDLTKLEPQGEEILGIRGKEIAMIFQEPMTSFGPLNTIGNQIMEAILLHQKGVGKKQARQMTVELLAKVGIPRPHDLVDAYPHQFSGGMRQRAMIAMALSCHPRILIADEPTTALDVTIQAQILELLKRLQQETGMSIIYITHNLAVVSEIADEIALMYLGHIMEHASVGKIINEPLHPYTKALWRSIPKIQGDLSRLVSITGNLPSPFEMPKGCAFCTRCEEVIPGVCEVSPPAVVDMGGGHRVSCFHYQGARGTADAKGVS